MDENERSRLYLNRLLKYEDFLKNNRFYSIQRIDLLIISLSGGGLYIIFEMIKFMKTPPGHDYDPLLLKVSGLLFALAIVSNFISQWTGWKANDIGLEVNEMEIAEEKGGDINHELKRFKDLSKRKYNTWTSYLNSFSTGVMIGGIMLLTLFTFVIL